LFQIYFDFKILHRVFILNLELLPTPIILLHFRQLYPLPSDLERLNGIIDELAEALQGPGELLSEALHELKSRSLIALQAIFTLF
jgi:hypothetical protein